MSVSAPTILCQSDSGNSPSKKKQSKIKKLLKMVRSILNKLTPATTKQSPKEKEKASTAQLSCKAEYAFKSEENNNDVDSEENKIKDLLKTVRSILNKITPATKDEFIKEFLALHVAGEPPEFNAPEGQLAQVIDVVFEKSISEPLYCPLYVELCKQHIDAEVKLLKYSSLRDALLQKCQDEFLRRRLGNINLLGQLYRWDLVSTKIIQWCLFDLLRHSHPDAAGNLPDPPYDEDSIHCATQLIEVVGNNFEFCKHLKGANIYLMQILDHLMRIAPKCSPKIRFGILALKELRDNCWEQRKIIVGGIPKTINEIHKEIESFDALRPPRRFSIIKYNSAAPNSPLSAMKYDVLETIARLRKRFPHDNGCGKYCTTRCPRMCQALKLLKNRGFWNEVEEFYPSIADQIIKYISDIQPA